MKPFKLKKHITPHVGFLLWGMVVLGFPLRAEGNNPTVTVMSFQPTGGRREAWLGKGLADLVTQQLAALSPHTVLERERMQEFIKEIEMANKGLTDADRALRLGRVARVDEVVYGAYSLEGTKISLSLFLLSINSQKILAQTTHNGSLTDLPGLVWRAVEKLQGARGRTPDPGDGPLVKSVSHDLKALGSFYRALDHHDQGRPADAYGDFAAAAQQDPTWADAALWRSKMLDDLEFPRQAAAGYAAVVKNFPKTPQGLDALALSAALKMGALKDSAGAEKDWRALMAQGPVAAQALEAAHRLGRLYESQHRPDQAYTAYRAVVDFSDRIIASGGSPGWGAVAPSRFFSWSHALSLRSDAAVRSVQVYKTILDQRGFSGAPPLPPGVFVAGGEHPAVRESLPGSRPPLFPVTQLPRWSERFFAVVAPPGQEATGARLTLKGRLRESQPYFSFDLRVTPFPFPAQYLQNWLGGIFGQTAQPTTLTKTVSFQGNNQGVVGIHVLEANAEISEWGVQLSVQPTSPPLFPPPDPIPSFFWEGQIQATLPLPAGTWAGAARPYEKEYRHPKRELALLRERGGGFRLVAVVGQLDGPHTDLWESRSSDGKTWTAPVRLTVNSAADDYDPRLIHAEDGRAALFWLSNRRGLGWDLWMSFSREDGWSPPQRVPFPDNPHPDLPTTELLEYAVVQNRRGEWIVAGSFPGDRNTRWLQSPDGTVWRAFAPAGLSGRWHGMALAEDGTARLLLSGFDGGGKILFAVSLDGKTWNARSFTAKFWNQWFTPETRPYRTEILTTGPRPRVLLSDSTYGLQFGSFPEGTAEPVLDLVARAGLEPTAAAADQEGSTWVAFKSNDRLLVRRYCSLTVGAEARQDTHGWPIYIDLEQDARGRRWERIHAQPRDRVSDVTSLGVGPDGRIWWGMETGVMSRQGESYFATDVSRGFFNNFVTDIQACGNTVWFASRELDRPVLSGSLVGSGNVFQTLPLPGTGAIRALACGKEGTLHVLTKPGELFLVRDRAVVARRTLPAELLPTAMAVDPASGEIWVGTEKQGLLRVIGSRQNKLDTLQGAPLRRINGLVFDREGALWISAANQGLFRWTSSAVRQFTAAAGLFTDDVGPLRADPRKGIWYLPSEKVRARGLGYFDGQRAEQFAPPPPSLDRPSGFDVDARGDVWIGTWSDGVYRLIREGR